MDKMKLNLLLSFVEEAEAMVEELQNNVYLNEEDPDEDDVACAIIKVEDALNELEIVLDTIEDSR